jgi:glutamyl/glutaminyl-tRNA synthetase
VKGLFASGSAARPGSALADSVRSRLQDPPLTRFAPAPTGDLHLGHVVNAIYVWGLARALGGRVLLRVEDHDRQRARAEAERHMLEDLDWLGLTADIHPSDSYRAGSCEGRQSERDAIYRRALAPLVDTGLIYACRCTRASQTAAAGSLCTASSQSAERPYAGTCRHLNLPLRDGLGWRLRLDPGTEVFEDGLLGRQQQDPSAQCGDLLLRDRLSNWTYQCVAAIDDAVQGVTLVVRGQDLLPSTGRQIRLARLVGRRDQAVFVHHPLIMKSATQKLSKSDGDSGIRDLRSAGWSASQVLGRAAALAGLLPEPDAVAGEELQKLFSPE